ADAHAAVEELRRSLKAYENATTPAANLATPVGAATQPEGHVPDRTFSSSNATTDDTANADTPSKAHANDQHGASKDATGAAAEIEAKRKADEDPRRKLNEDATIAADKSKATGRIAGLVTGGAGIASLAIGVAYGLHAKSISDEVPHWDTFHQARFD